MLSLTNEHTKFPLENVMLELESPNDGFDVTKKFDWKLRFKVRKRPRLPEDGLLQIITSALFFKLNEIMSISK